MAIYFVLLVWSIISWYLLKFFVMGSVKRKKAYLILNYIPMFVVAALRRNGVGTDSESYYGVFNAINVDDFLEVINDFSYLIGFGDVYNRQEPGFYILSMVIKAFSDNGQIFFGFMSFFTLSLYAFVFYKTSISIWISTFVFLGMGFYVETFNTMRQTLGTGIILLAWLFLKNGKKWICFFLTLLATRFHYSLIVFLPFCYLININNNKFIKYSIYSVLLTIIVFVAGQVVLEVLFSETKYITYLLNPEQNMNYFHLCKIVMFVVFIYCGYFLLERNNKILLDNKEIYYYCSLFMLIACEVTFLQCFQMYIYQRLFMQFAVFFCILVPIIIQGVWCEIKSENKLIIMYMLCVTFMSAISIYLYGYLQNVNARFEYFLY